jgi:HSP20 family protein
MTASDGNTEVVDMMRKDKSSRAKEESTLAKATPSPFIWFDEMDRWFDSFRRTFEDRFWGSPVERWDGDVVRQPLVDLLDKGSEFVVRAELPGVSKDDVDVKVTADSIEIRAEANRVREENEKDYAFRERTYQALHRILSFPEEVKADLASAALKDGVLEVRVPKKEPTPEKTPVKVPVE